MMRKLWSGVFLAQLVLLLTASKAAEEPKEKVIEPIFSEATYLGPILSERGFAQRALDRRSTAAGSIDVYNVWTSFESIKWNNNYSIRGHGYEFCSNSDRFVEFGHVIYFFGNSGEVKVTYTLSKADRMTTTTYFNLNTDGYWLLTDRFPITDFRLGYYKVKAKHTITRGGSGTGTESCFFDVLDCR